MALAKSLHASALFKVTPPSLAAAASHASGAASRLPSLGAAARASGIVTAAAADRTSADASYSQIRAMSTSQRRLAAVEGTFRIEKDTFGELKVGGG